MLHAMIYKYLGEKTVHMKRCVLSIVHATITAKTLLEAKTVSNATYCSKDLEMVPSRLLDGTLPPALGELGFFCVVRRSTVAEVHHTGPAQLLRKVKSPTAPTLYPATPL